MKTVKHFLASALLTASATTFAQTMVTITTDSTATTTVRTDRPARFTSRVSNDFAIYVGLNNFDGTLPAGYEFRPLGSRFIALGWQKRIPLFTGGSTQLRLITGPEVAWNNFMFEGRAVLRQQNGQLTIEPASVSLHKSKLVTAQLNLPVMLNVRLREGLSWSVGAYAGIRLDSYTKVKPDGGLALRTHGSFNLNPVRWGFLTEIGFRNDVKLFGRYEPHSPFKTGLGPDAGVWAVGIKL